MALIPIYNSKGDAEAFLDYPYLFNRNGDWVGFVSPRREVYSVLGHYVGYLSNEPRILRKAATSSLKPRMQVPKPPREKVYPPATVPLAPLMRELTASSVDGLLGEPERVRPIDTGELRG